MQEVFEKIIEKLEEKHEQYINQYGVVGGNPMAFAVKECKEIVKQEAEQYTSTEHINCSSDSSTNGWIPCSERLPEERNHNVLVTYEDRYIGGIYGVCEGQYVHGLKEWHISDYDIRDDYNVIAWCEKPAPYVQK